MLDSIIEIAKHAPTRMSRREWYEEILKRSEQQRPVGESQAIAFTRYVTKTEEGKALFNAYYSARGPYWHPPVRIAKAEVPNQFVAMSKLEKLAEQVRAANPRLTSARAFNRVLASPEGVALYKQDKSERPGMAVA